MNEQEILAAMDEALLERKEAKDRIAFHKKAAVDAESDLIAANLRYERLKEDLRVFRITNPIQEETPREKEIAIFRERLPELLKKI